MHWKSSSLLERVPYINKTELSSTDANWSMRPLNDWMYVCISAQSINAEQDSIIKERAKEGERKREWCILCWVRSHHSKWALKLHLKGWLLFQYRIIILAWKQFFPFYSFSWNERPEWISILICAENFNWTFYLGLNISHWIPLVLPSKLMSKFRRSDFKKNGTSNYLHSNWFSIYTVNRSFTVSNVLNS